MTITYEQIASHLDQFHDYPGGNYGTAICPFHDDNHPSLMVYKDGWFRCLASSCGKSGDWYMLWQKIQGGGGYGVAVETTIQWDPIFNETLDEKLCIDAHCILRTYQDSFAWYLRMRGVDDRIIPQKLGYWNGWYTLPVYEQTGEYKGVVIRAAPFIQKSKGHRFHTPKGQPAMMYVPDWKLFKMGNSLFIVFGMFDALSLCQLRIPVCTTTAGQLSFLPEWIADQRKQIYIVPDAGEEEAARGLANKLGWRSKVLRLVYPDGTKDPNGFFEIGRPDLLMNQLMRYL